MVYGFYHSKSPFFITIWGMFFIFSNHLKQMQVYLSLPPSRPDMRPVPPHPRACCLEARGFVVGIRKCQKKTFQVILCALFGMITVPVQRLSDLQLGDQKVTLNHLLVMFSYFCICIFSYRQLLTNTMYTYLHTCCDLLWVKSQPKYSRCDWKPNWVQIEVENHSGHNRGLH